MALLRQVDENLQHVHRLARLGRHLLVHHPFTRRRPVQPTGSNQVAVAQRVAVINPGFGIKKQIGHSRETGMRVWWKSWPADPGMIDSKERVDRLGELISTQTESPKLTAVIHALQACKG
ncbi:hypothetical protein D3C87_1622310 [compost metagenome]